MLFTCPMLCLFSEACHKARKRGGGLNFSVRALMMLGAALKAVDVLGLGEADTSFAPYCLR
jgi:hypothetical protein